MLYVAFQSTFLQNSPWNSKNPRKMHFAANYRLKFQKFSLRCLPWGHPTEPLNQANSKENKPLVKNGCRQSCLDKSLTGASSLLLFFLIFFFIAVIINVSICSHTLFVWFLLLSNVFTCLQWKKHLYARQ